MNEWQPIETAPQTGENIILWDGSRVGEAFYDKHFPTWCWIDESRVRGDYDNFQWQPMPVPPNSP